MSQIISTYPIFEGSQVLTSSQLNQLTSYLDQQGRLTRSKLIGIGNVCGMQIQPFPQGLQISKGLGITSEGFLIQAGTFKATHYRPYQLPEGVEYKPFKDVDHEVSLFELLTEIPEDNTGVKKLTNPANFLNNKYVLIFLEIFDKDLKSCLGNACDDRGKDRLFSIRRLLVSQADLDKILTKSSNVTAPFPNGLELPDFYVQKPLFYPGNPESNEYGAFVKFYQERISKILNEELKEALALTFKTFEPILGKSYGFENPFESSTLSDQWDGINSIVTADPNEIHGIQYLWDFAKELIKAYLEFKSVAQELWYTCPSDSSLFPLHLMLGRARVDLETQNQFLKYRHGFIQPPIFNQQKLLAETCVQRHRRLVLLLEQLELGIFNREEFEKFPVKITPSVEKIGVLGDRAIPYYYDIKSKSNLSTWYSLEENWVDPGIPQLISSQRIGVQSYDNQPDVEATEASNPLETPLFYDLESYPFLRIEGHLSKSLGETVSQLKKLILQFNLPIHVDVLHLGEIEETEIVENCGWKDLQEEYSFQRRIVVGYINGLKDIFEYATEYAEKNEEEDFTEEELYQKASETLEMLLSMAAALPDCLKELQWKNFQNAYKKLLQLLIDFVLIDQKLLEEIKVDPNKEKEVDFFNGLLMRISPFLYQILDLLFFSKLQRVYTSYQSRILVILRSNQFSNYLKKHPGLTHEAGVLKAGTFFLLHDPKQERIIGDFSLPYYCCECTPCLEACIEDAIVLPPFARPDYAIAYTEKSTRLEITINDFLTPGRTYEVILLGNNSVQNGQIKKLPNSNTIEYISAKGFTGIDSFQYILRDTESKLSDQGKVSILVKGIEGCYSVDILACWGMERVRQALEERKIDASNEDDQRALELLLSSLQKTKGFTDEDLNSGILEEDAERLALLGCLGIATDGMSYQQMEEAILNHQAQNCGGVIIPECDSMAIEGKVTSIDGKELPEVRVYIEGVDSDTFTDGSGNYSLQFPSPGQTVIFEFEGFVTQEVDVCNQKLVNVTLSPSAQQARECYSIAIISTWEENFIREVAKTRGVQNPSGDLTSVIVELLTKLRETKGFTSSEMAETTVSSFERQKMILESVGADTSLMKPEQFVSAILSYQNSNCGSRTEEMIIVRAESLPEAELKKYLDTNRVSYFPGADKTVLVETFNAHTTDSTITKKDLEIFKKETLLKLSEEKSIEVRPTDTKARLIEKLLGKK